MSLIPPRGERESLAEYNARIQAWELNLRRQEASRIEEERIRNSRPKSQFEIEMDKLRNRSQPQTEADKAYDEQIKKQADKARLDAARREQARIEKYRDDAYKNQSSQTQQPWDYKKFQEGGDAIRQRDEQIKNNKIEAENQKAIERYRQGELWKNGGGQPTGNKNQWEIEAEKQAQRDLWAKQQKEIEQSNKDKEEWFRQRKIKAEQSYQDYKYKETFEPKQQGPKEPPKPSFTVPGSGKSADEYQRDRMTPSKPISQSGKPFQFKEPPKGMPDYFKPGFAPRPPNSGDALKAPPVFKPYNPNSVIPSRPLPMGKGLGVGQLISQGLQYWQSKQELDKAMNEINRLKEKYGVSDKEFLETIKKYEPKYVDGEMIQNPWEFDPFAPGGWKDMLEARKRGIDPYRYKKERFGDQRDVEPVKPSGSWGKPFGPEFSKDVEKMIDEAIKKADKEWQKDREKWKKYWDDRDKGLFPPRPDGEPDDYRDPFAPIGPDPVPAPPSQPIVYAQIWARHDPGPGYEGALVWYSYIDVYPNAGEPSIRGDLGWDGLFLSHAAGHVSRIETAYRMRGDDTLIGNGPFFQGYGEEIPDEEFYRNKWRFKWTWDESTKLGHAYLGYPEQEEMYRLSFDQERFKRREKFQFPYGVPTQLKIVRYGPDNRPFTPPLPDEPNPFPEDDNDMACRYAEDQETPTALAYFNPVTGKKEYATKMTHKGVDDALSFLAEKMAELGEQVHSVVKATEADQYRQPAGKVAFPVAAMEVPQTILQGDFTKPFPVKSMPQEMALYNSMARVEQGRHLLGRLEMPSNPNISPDTQTNPMQRPKTMMGWMHKMYDNLSGQVGVPTPHKVMKSDGTFEEDSFRNSADIAETTHAKVSSLEQDISSLQEMLFKVIQQNEMLIQMCFKTDAKADFLIKDTGARITYEKATIPSVIQHGKPKDDAAKALFNWDKTFKQGDAHTTIPVWKGEIDKHQLLQKTNIQAQIAASSVFFPLAKDNKDSIPRLGKPKQSDTNWLSYVKSVNEPPENTPLQGSNIPQPKIELIDNGVARDINTSSASYLTK
jgi:hypothetical protein